jgi:hypothetical protein
MMADDATFRPASTEGFKALYNLLEPGKKLLGIDLL